jgi:hypothetical protein
MSEATERWIAACGLDCEACEIRRVPFDAEAAQSVVARFREQGWLEADEGVTEILARRMYCKGCHGDREVHWSPDCWILHCCVDDKGLQDCSECEAFPCDRLHQWSSQNDGYGRALQRLQQLKAEHSA